VSQAPGTTSTQTIEEIVGGKLLSIQETVGIEVGDCVPAPGVGTIGVWVTADEVIFVAVTTQVLTKGLVLATRTLRCDGTLYYASFSLDGAPIGTRSVFLFPVTPGYLLDASITDFTATLPNGTCLVQFGLQRGFQTAAVPQVLLGQGWVSTTMGMCWPAQAQGLPVTTPGVALPLIGMPTPAQVRGGWGFGNTLAVTFSATVASGAMILACVKAEGSFSAGTVTDDKGATYTLLIDHPSFQIFLAVPAIAGTQVVTYHYPGTNASLANMHIYEFDGAPATSSLDTNNWNEGNYPPISVTTASANHQDLVVALASVNAATSGQFADQPGYTKYGNTNDSSGKVFSTFIYNSLQGPGVQLSFTANISPYVYTMMGVLGIVINP
jgi:hypothetical protein